MEQVLPFLLAALIVGAAKGWPCLGGCPGSASAVADCRSTGGCRHAVARVHRQRCHGVWLCRRAFSLPDVLTLASSGLAGVALAAALPPCIPVVWLTLLTGMIGLPHLLQVDLRRALAGRATSKEVRLLPGLFWGLPTGITSFVSHSGTPPFQRLMLPQHLPKPVCAGTSTLAFAAINLGKWPACLAAGLANGQPLFQMTLLCAAGVFGAPIGRWLALRLSGRIHLAATEVLLLATSLQLVSQSIIALL